jgi:hypothetical protein
MKRRKHFQFYQFAKKLKFSFISALPNPIDPDSLFLHGLLHVHVPGELAHLLHRGLRHQEERDLDQESKSHAWMGSAAGRRICNNDLLKV